MLSKDCVWLVGKEERVLVDPSRDLAFDKKYRSRVVIFCDKSKDWLGIAFDGVIIEGPGDYEVGGVEIKGIDSNGGGCVYVVNMDGVKLAVVAGLGNENGKRLVEKIKEVDVLILKDGVGERLGLEIAKKWGVNYLVLAGMEEGLLNKVLDETDQEGLKAVEGFKVKPDSLPDGMEVVVLKEE